ncbi:MAG: nuclease [Terriglobus sp.]
MRLRLVLTAALVCAAHMYAQQQLGTVKTQGNEVSGLVTVSNGNAVIGNSGAVTTGVQPADVTLNRGGTVKVCSGSAVHLSQTTINVARPPLMVALDRGAMEVRTNAGKMDSILTPDLRFELSDGAPLDLRIRTVSNGDTCVENAGKEAPVLHVTETFGDATYFVRPGQRVLFEHGSLREVVDHESSSCGCPKADDLVLAGKGRLGDGKITEAAKAHPFPEAVSQGLQQPEQPQLAPVGETHTRVNSTLTYNGATNTVSGPPGQTVTAADVIPAGTSTTPAPAKQAADIHVASTKPPEDGPHPFRAIGHFFRKLFGVHDDN